jgi:hypothetical protein
MQHQGEMKTGRSVEIGVEVDLRSSFVQARNMLIASRLKLILLLSWIHPRPFSQCCSVCKVER